MEDILNSQCPYDVMAKICRVKVTHQNNTKFHLAKKAKNISSFWFRSRVLRVMSPTRFHCAKLLVENSRRKIDDTGDSGHGVLACRKLPHMTSSKPLQHVSFRSSSKSGLQFNGTIPSTQKQSRRRLPHLGLHLNRRAARPNRS